MRVELLRLATIRLSSPPPRNVSRAPYTASNGLVVAVGHVDGLTGSGGGFAGGVVVAWPYESEKVRLGVSVTTPVAKVERLNDGRLVVPRAAREAAERAIADFADLLAVVHQCRRDLRSPRPAVALLPGPQDSDAARAAVGLAQEQVSRPSARLMPAADPADLSAALRDRQDGIQMLADALAEDSAVGRARELFRLFERAFGKGPSGCVGPMTELLAAGPRHDASAYSREEVVAWMNDLRPLAVHGDRRQDFARSPDLAPYIARIEWAAYDVLLHKQTWRTPSSTRRPLLVLTAVPAADGTQTVLLSRNATITVDHLDPHGVWPVDWEAQAHLEPPWVWRLPGQEKD